MKGNVNEIDVLQMYDDDYSTHQIAKKYNTYPNKIRRIYIRLLKPTKTRKAK